MKYANDTGLANLGNAVVARAAQDLRVAIVNHDVNAVKELKEFFTGPNIKAFTTLDGNELLENIMSENSATRKARIRAYHRSN